MIRGSPRYALPVPPRVSVCIPAYRAAWSIGKALESVFAQSLEDFELVVVDDCSPDETSSVIAGYADPRIRAYRNPLNLGQAGTTNRCIELARAPLVKFLHADDALEPDCLSSMATVFDEAPSVGLVFARRHIELEDPDAPDLVEWERVYGDLHHPFGALGRINDGRSLFDRFIRAGIPGNWVGEPSSVMMRRSCFGRIGLFSERLQQILDTDMWLRAMFFYDVGFVDARLSRYFVGRNSVTGANVRGGGAWLDHLWLLEGLMSLPEIRRAYPELVVRRRLEQRRAGRALIGTLRRSPASILPRLRSLAPYALRQLGGGFAPFRTVQVLDLET